MTPQVMVAVETAIVVHSGKWIIVVVIVLDTMIGWMMTIAAVACARRGGWRIQRPLLSSIRERCVEAPPQLLVERVLVGADATGIADGLVLWHIVVIIGLKKDAAVVGEAAVVADVGATSAAAAVEQVPGDDERAIRDVGLG